MSQKTQQWKVGELEMEGFPVLIRHRLSFATMPNPRHDWLAIVTHHLAKVQANGLPEPDYNDSLQDLDRIIIEALQPRRGDLVFLVETCLGKRHYYSYVKGFDAVGKSVNGCVNKHHGHVLSFRSVLDPEHNFAIKYSAMISKGT